ncbi:FAD-binding oxidoreductase [Actinopolyspora erythraea]|uniref:Delta(24)-sterol reductase n=1 Tax=Actinopolyspora erythraea TaxID=414996 RepID=A0A099D4H6_9ACTN|nr:FAD-binding oxidoreductase [Actinopolyspora erythraea]ASU79447.1 FAD-binding oxidoreductase [Actinopolyspora erythraea]KGI80929.1 FAD-linked oxidase [Actinopolyspora erythraea]
MESDSPAPPGDVEHSDEVAALAARYRRIPASERVRLAKSTSNLFRFRSPVSGGLDVTGLDRVLRVDPERRVADVQGMTTFEDLVAATLPYGLMPLVVPQLKTITLGGAVAGLGIESSSFRNGLPHESVLEMEILTGDGRVVLARPDNEHAELFRGFPNSYGSLGYALRLLIELQPVRDHVRLRHVRFGSAAECAEAIERISGSGTWEDRRVDFLDGTVFGPDELYLTLGTFTSRAPYDSDYTGNRIYYRSIREREVDHLRVRDYLWRWDTDWFWCSHAFGAQHPAIRPFWPRRWLRSDVYRRLVALDQRYRLSDRLNRMRGRPSREPVIQDVEIPLGRLTEFLEFFHAEIGISPVWLCPVRLRDGAGWPLYPMDPATLYVNVGFWATVPLREGQVTGAHNRAIEAKVSELDGHKSLYSTAYYEPEEFWRRYDGATYQRLKRRYDESGRLPGLYDKCVLGS